MKPQLLILPTVFGLFYLAIFSWPSGSLPLIQEFGVFFALGLAGALVANSTGAGGGVIFIPFFSAIGFTSSEAVGTSMAIQCFGMTAGSVAWLNNIQRHPESVACKLPVIRKLLLATGPPTIVGVLLGQYVLPQPEIEVTEIFRWFSIVFGIILFAYTWLNRKLIVEETHEVHLRKCILLAVTALVGGVVTSWISVGVGEILALLLFFLGFSPALAVAIGVYSSSLSVLTGVVFHIFGHNISIEVLLFAGQAALIGGYLARHITHRLGGYYLKLFFALWIFISGVFIG